MLASGHGACKRFLTARYWSRWSGQLGGNLMRNVGSVEAGHVRLRTLSKAEPRGTVKPTYSVLIQLSKGIGRDDCRKGTRKRPFKERASMVDCIVYLSRQYEAERTSKEGNERKIRRAESLELLALKNANGTSKTTLSSR